MTQADRRTRGFLFADLRGYTAFVEAHGDTAAAALLSAYRDLVRETVARFAGAEIKTEGDSFYVAFDAASGAVECGLALIDAAAAASRDHPERPIRVGVGIHAGETIEMDGGYVGSAVNVAARVCSVARAGEVAISETVQGLVRTGLPVHFVLRGTPKLKGIEQPIAIYAVKHGPAPTIPAWRKVAARRGGPGVGLLAAAVVVAIVGSLGGVVLFAGGLTAPGASGPPNAGAIASQSQPILSSPVAPNSQDPAGSVDPADSSPSHTAAAGLFPGRLAFGRSADNESFIFVSGADGSSVKQLTRAGEFAGAADWSPNGDQIVYLRQVTVETQVNQYNQAFVMDADGTEPRQLTNLPNGVTSVDWSPDGTEIALGVGLDDRGSDAGAIGILQIATGVVEQLPRPPGVAYISPRWSPDGTRLLVSRVPTEDGVPGGELLVLDPQSGETTTIYPNTVRDAAWSPDGRRIVFSDSESEVLRPDIYMMNSDGSGIEQLTNHPAFDLDPCWSPDGSWIAFASDRDYHYELYALDVRSGTLARLTTTPQDVHNGSPAWTGTLP